ncbi:MAG TPA: hypothetical protein VN889_04120 [Solirubrobacteraceae bacterium]|nr:hypothetical protein [Solirubrobacteraceae bacterium]
MLDLLEQALGQQERIGRGQLGPADLDGRFGPVVVPFGGDEQLPKERLVVAAPCLLVSGEVDGLYVLGQLQSQL